MELSSKVQGRLQTIIFSLDTTLVCIVENFKFLTVCPWANQPAEKVTAPGSSLFTTVLLTKLLSFILQFGARLLKTFFFIDLFNKGEMLMVACLISNYS